MPAHGIDDSQWDGFAPLHEADMHIRVPLPRHVIVSKWQEAARKALSWSIDPWARFKINEQPIIEVKRYRYSSIRKCWTEDIVKIKMCSEPFAHGAMRECFRVKKLSSLAKHEDWNQAQNYVAKSYIQDVDRSVLFKDVELQMDCKLWAEEFNRQHPPKKIDIMQMCVIELINSPGSQLFHLENFIEGEYIKYNSNSGFVSDLARKTPQAFSHFTFERSGHQLIVVDIQGVGDLYTDPQIHTANGTEYNDGNLGTRGMALFFHSHKCNDLCHMLCLTEFDLTDSEKETLDCPSIICESTKFIRNRCEIEACEPLIVPNGGEFENAMDCLRRRTLSYRSRSSSISQTESGGDHGDECMCEDCVKALLKDESTEAIADDEEASIRSEERPQRKTRFASSESHDSAIRNRYDSFSLYTPSQASADASSRITGRTERDEFFANMRKKSIPAGLLDAMQMNFCHEAANVTRQISVLGQIHLDMARYHESGRFMKGVIDEDKLKVMVELGDDSTNSPATKKGRKNGEYDHQSALFHLDVARRCGVLEAIIGVAQMLYGLPHELLKDVDTETPGFTTIYGATEAEREKFAFEMMLTAAEMGDRVSMLFTAQAYEMGRWMGPEANASYPKAIFWYQQCMGFEEADDGADSAKPKHEIFATMAKMYQEGGHGLDQDYSRAYELYNEAAEAAAECMKGKLASKYYELAEMCAE